MSVDQHPGVGVLEDPLRNKGTAFSEDERSELGLRGLLPTVVETLEQQVLRRYQAYQKQPTNVARHTNLRALQDTNETLFYGLVSDHIEEMLPILYTPTVGVACQYFKEIYRRPRGLFISYPDRERIAEILHNRPRREVDVIVVTDGQRVLGLGDQGIGGMGTRSASYRCTQPWVASALRAPCRCSSTSAPTTPSSSTTPCTSAGATAVSAAQTRL